ncbi:MAG: hypothetical protein AB8G11_06335 [Saprospiraceae bacterium]
MNYSKLQDIDELKLKIKTILIEDIDLSLTELSKVLKGNKASDTLLFKMQYNDLKKNENLGLLTDEQKRVRKAQLVNGINGFTDNLKDRHFNPDIIAQFGSSPKSDNEKESLPIESLPTQPIRQLENTKPVVALLVFANDTDVPLKNLQEEEKEVKYALKHFEKAGGNIEVVTVSSVDEIFRYFNLYKGQIGLIHYGGHASGKGLQIDGTLANANGLANLMGTEPNLQFVFLNGCATKDQVKLLQENNVRTVIATSVPINDRKATDFAVRFYQNLTFFDGENTLEDAFKNAKAYIETTSITPVDIELTRGFIFKEDKPINAFNWALYGNEENWKWKLPKMGILKKNENNGNIETVEKTISNNNLSDEKRKNLEDRKALIEKRIGQYKNRILAGGLSLDQEFAAQDKVAEFEKELAKVNKELGLS